MFPQLVLVCLSLLCTTFFYSTTLAASKKKGRDDIVLEERLNDENFQKWLKEFKPVARKEADITSEEFDRFFKGVKFNPKVVRLDRNQPEFKMSWKTYKGIILGKNKSRVKGGAKALMDPEILKQVTAVEKKYGVPKKYIIALWGVESNFGALVGGYNVVEALATLVFEGRRKKFFTTELVATLKALKSGDITPEKALGSWAGAMGQCQFMPTTYQGYAQDWDGDGKRDIWGNRGDVFASIANLIKSNGWQGSVWGVPVGFVELVDKKHQGVKVQKTLAEWQEMGVRRVNNLHFRNLKLKASLVCYDDCREAYLVFNNYRAVMKWNNSNFFATAVGLLGDAIEAEWRKMKKKG